MIHDRSRQTLYKYKKSGASPRLEWWNVGVMEYWVLGKWKIGLL
jgi:hypothetical protein